MQVFDTNVLIYAVDDDSEFQGPCRELLERSRRDPSPSFLTWNICYEFIRISTHLALPRMHWSSNEAWRFLEQLLESPGFSMLTPTHRHAVVLTQTLSELPDIRGNTVHDLHTAALMREHGVSRICTRDTDFHRFPFLTVIDPLRHP